MKIPKLSIETDVLHDSGFQFLQRVRVKDPEKRESKLFRPGESQAVAKFYAGADGLAIRLQEDGGILVVFDTRGLLPESDRITEVIDPMDLEPA